MPVPRSELFVQHNKINLLPDILENYAVLQILSQKLDVYKMTHKNMSILSWTAFKTIRWDLKCGLQVLTVDLQL